jgi:hypothetical protein
LVSSEHGGGDDDDGHDGHDDDDDDVDNSDGVKSGEVEEFGRLGNQLSDKTAVFVAKTFRSACFESFPASR